MVSADDVEMFSILGHNDGVVAVLSATPLAG